MKWYEITNLKLLNGISNGNDNGIGNDNGKDSVADSNDNGKTFEINLTWQY